MANRKKISSVIPQHIRRLPPLPDFEGRQKFIRLDLNETPAAELPARIRRPLTNLGIYEIGTYPAYNELIQKISDYARVSADSIAVTNGSDDAIPKAVSLLFKRGGRVVVPVPTFQTYYRALALQETKPIFIPYAFDGSDFSFPFSAVLKAIRKKPRPAGLIICNPGNPIGVVLEKKRLVELIRLTGKLGIPFLIDEAYFEYFGTSAVSFVRAFSHVLVLRSFSKAFGMAGLRLGYVIGHPTVIAEFKKLTLPWQVNHAAVHAAKIVLKNRSFYASSIKKIKARGKELSAALSKAGIRVFGTETNFIIADVKDAESYAVRTKKRGVLVKPLALYAGVVPVLKRIVRITIPGESSMRKAKKTLIDSL